MKIYCKLFLTAALWGGTFVAGRALGQGVPPACSAFLRFLSASLILLPVVLLSGKDGLHAATHLTSRQIIGVILLGATGVFSYNLCFFNGLRLIPAGRASLIIALNPVFISLMAIFLFRERPGALKYAGIILSVCGALVVISKGDLSLLVSGGGLGWGELCIFGAVASWVSFSLIGKVILDGMKPLVAITWASVVGSLFLLPPALNSGLVSVAPGLSVQDWSAILYLGILGTATGFIWYYQGIREIGPSRAGLFINFVPIFAILSAFVFLHEPVTISLAVGAVMVSIGVYMTNNGPVRIAGKA